MGEINKASILRSYQLPLGMATANPNTVLIAGGTASIPTGRPFTVESSHLAEPRNSVVGVDCTQTQETRWPTRPGLQIFSMDQECTECCECCCDPDPNDRPPPAPPPDWQCPALPDPPNISEVDPEAFLPPERTAFVENLPDGNPTTDFSFGRSVQANPFAPDTMALYTTDRFRDHHSLVSPHSLGKVPGGPEIHLFSTPDGKAMDICGGIITAYFTNCSQTDLKAIQIVKHGPETRVLCDGTVSVRPATSWSFDTLVPSMEDDDGKPLEGPALQSAVQEFNQRVRTYPYYEQISETSTAGNKGALFFDSPGFSKQRLFELASGKEQKDLCSLSAHYDFYTYFYCSRQVAQASEVLRPWTLFQPRKVWNTLLGRLQWCLEMHFNFGCPVRINGVLQPRQDPVLKVWWCHPIWFSGAYLEAIRHDRDPGLDAFAEANRHVPSWPPPRKPEPVIGPVNPYNPP